VPLDVAPLFESVASLASCGAALRTLLAEPLYRRHVAARGNRQGVMIGYADSNKDSGFAASRWALHQAQALLSDSVQGTGIKLTISHGRGTAGSRSTSRPEALLRSAPVGSFGGVLRVTEQGEAINQNYALRQIASRSLEQALGAASQTLAAGPQGAALDPACAAAFDTIATESMAAYRCFVYDGGEFYRYFREVTPIDVIERMQIGSRPAMRAGRSGVDAMRSVPWGFAWSQSRHLIPAWFGFGAGLEAAEARHGAGVLEHMAAQWSFFGSVVDEVEFGLAIADMTIASWYAELASAERRALFAGVQAEYERTQAWILRLRGERRLLDSDPGIQRAMKLRNPYVDPMHLMQIDLLRRWRVTGRQDLDLLDALVASIGGIAQGLQATG
jgi:phosphoenolpyruvate carboxylase